VSDLDGRRYGHPGDNTRRTSSPRRVERQALGLPEKFWLSLSRFDDPGLLSLI
jgi:hypothetical protein